MRVSVNPSTGAMEFDASPEEAVALMRLQQNGSSEKIETPKPALTVPVDKDTSGWCSGDEAGLTKTQYETWDYLVQHGDAGAGVTCAAVARHFQITSSAASCRLNNLVLMNFAQRVQRGRYMAVCP